MNTILPQPDPARAYDEVRDPENETTPQHAAYLEADTLTFRGVPLRPFSPRRMAAAQSIGLRLWSMTDEERAAAATFDAAGKLTSYSYSGIYNDSLTVVFLCTCPNSDTLLAVRKPGIVADKILSWADEHNVRMDDEELTACFAACIAHLAASAGEPVPSKEKGESGNG